MPLAPKLAATVLAAATVATLSCTPAHADPVLPPLDDGGTIHMTWETVQEISAVLFRCRQVEVEEEAEQRVCVEDPLS